MKIAIFADKEWNITVGNRKRQSAYLLERFESRKRQGICGHLQFESRKRQHVPNQKSNSRKRQREYRRPSVYFTQSPRKFKHAWHKTVV